MSKRLVTKAVFHYHGGATETVHRGERPLTETIYLPCIDSDERGAVEVEIHTSRGLSHTETPEGPFISGNWNDRIEA